ncbi:ATP-binding protein [Limnohabitans sp.]|uniref:ATP-binding protein n=1 Tax=Limnohabitans sp. TaxID=1907725 RepID=UPI00286F8258|nr:ATP-binding protein [Limnohabitans sp.]
MHTKTRPHGAQAVSAADLRLTLNPQELGFADTSELVTQALPWIGQERAETAARFGLEMTQANYNLFVLGEIGSGRSTLLQQMMRSVATTRPVPPDLCYLHNFDTPEHPHAVHISAGEGRKLRLHMAQLTKTLLAEIPKRLTAQDFKVESEHIEKTYKQEEDRAYAVLDAFAEARSFSLFREGGHLVFTLRDDKGMPLTEAEALALPKERRTAIDQAENELRAEIANFLDKTRPIDRVKNEGLASLRRQTIKPLLEQELLHIQQALAKPTQDNPKLVHYFSKVMADVLTHIELFEPHDDAEDEEDTRLEALNTLLMRYRINVAVDNHDALGAPVVVEDNPVFRTLFGSVEYQTEDDVLMTDFSRIRAGSLLKAHGGFLMLHVCDLLTDPLVWEKLSRFLRSGRLQIEESGLHLSPIAAVALEPETVEIDVKIVLIGTVEEYYVLQEGAPEFFRRFMCKVEFAESFAASADTHRASAVFVAHSCQRLGLPHFSADAVARLIECTHREVDDQTRQSALFSHTESLIIESASHARQLSADKVQAAHVDAAIAAREFRNGYIEQRLQESITDGERLISLQGEKVGQLNGLTVIELGDHAFGFPVRVTARTYAGNQGLVNIEREVKLSGPIHDKGVLILHSYLSALFSHIAPLAFNASVVFEQEYSGVEGDSASCAELYALLSSLSGLPLQQNIAVTGAVNQNGEILPVGGVNEKIEGFFRTCQNQGLNGTQGVLIPRRNCHNLMLSHQVVDAVTQGKFHIYSADHASEGAALLMNTPFETVLALSQNVLQTYRQLCKATLAHTP